MTHDGGKPHAVGYRGQAFKVTVYDEATDQRMIVGWRNTTMKWAEMRALETRPGWTMARCEPVTDKQTGE
jgi:hypothetical protein